MFCPFCQAQDTKVIDSRLVGDGSQIKRRRECEVCHARLTEIRQLGEREIASRQLGEIVMRNLKRVDQVAYVRFASVYRDFQDIKEFAEEISSLSKEKSKVSKKKNERH